MNNFLVIAYSIGAASFFRIWLNLFKKDNNLSKQEKRLSWMILIIATTFWPIVVPISYFEILSAKVRSVLNKKQGEYSFFERHVTKQNMGHNPPLL